MISLRLVKKLPRAYDLKLSPDGNIMVRSSGASVSLYNANTFEPMAVFKDIPYSGEIEFSQDSKYMAIKSTVPKIAVYDLDQLQLMKVIPIKKTSQPQDDGFCFSAGGNDLYNCVYTNQLLGYISKINVGTGETRVFYLSPNCVYRNIKYIPSKNRYHINGFERAELCNKYFLLVYDETLHEIKRYPIPFEYLHLLYHPQTNTYIATTHCEVHILSDDLASVLQSVPISCCQDIIKGDIVTSACLSHNGRIFAVGLMSHVKIFNSSTMDQIGEIRHEYIDSVCFSPDGRYLLIGDSSNGYVYQICE